VTNQIFDVDDDERGQPSAYENKQAAELVRVANLWRQHGRALWAVRVLDRWAEKTGETASHDTCRKPIGTWWCTVWQGYEGDDDAQHYKADSADAARIAAAEALVAEDPTLGEGL
jgi:hypothetical protein